MRLSFGDPLENTIANPYGSLWQIMHGTTRKAPPRARRKPRTLPRADSVRGNEFGYDEQLGEAGSLNGAAYQELLNQCREDIDRVREVRLHMQRSGYGGSKTLAVQLVRIFCDRALLREARSCFDAARSQAWTARDTDCCDALITAFARNGQYDESVLLFNQMLHRGISSWDSIVAAAAAGRGADEACFWFRKMPGQSCAALNALLAAYARLGFPSGPSRRLLSTALLEGVVDRSLPLFKG